MKSNSQEKTKMYMKAIILGCLLLAGGLFCSGCAVGRSYNRMAHGYIYIKNDGTNIEDQFRKDLDGISPGKEWAEKALELAHRYQLEGYGSIASCGFKFSSCSRALGRLIAEMPISVVDRFDLADAVDLLFRPHVFSKYDHMDCSLELWELLIQSNPRPAYSENARFFRERFLAESGNYLAEASMVGEGHGHSRRVGWVPGPIWIFHYNEMLRVNALPREQVAADIISAVESKNTAAMHLFYFKHRENLGSYFNELDPFLLAVRKNIERTPVQTQSSNDDRWRAHIAANVIASLVGRGRVSPQNGLNHIRAISAIQSHEAIVRSSFINVADGRELRKKELNWEQRTLEDRLIHGQATVQALGAGRAHSGLAVDEGWTLAAIPHRSSHSGIANSFKYAYLIRDTFSQSYRATVIVLSRRELQVGSRGTNLSGYWSDHQQNDVLLEVEENIVRRRYRVESPWRYFYAE